MDLVFSAATASLHHVFASSSLSFFLFPTLMSGAMFASSRLHGPRGAAPPARSLTCSLDPLWLREKRTRVLSVTHTCLHHPQPSYLVGSHPRMPDKGIWPFFQHSWNVGGIAHTASKYARPPFSRDRLRWRRQPLCSEHPALQQFKSLDRDRVGRLCSSKLISNHCADYGL